MDESDSFDALLQEIASAPPLPVEDPHLGRHLGPYRVEARIGHGGVGTVYRARDERLERDVALKVLPASASPDEARHAARTAHPNIARIYDVGATEAVRWIAFELIEGPTLAEIFSQESPSVDEADDCALGLAQALAHLHGRGLVHGDISPRNVLWRAEEQGPGHPVLIDFGLSDAVGTKRIAGTAGFVAPEVLDGAPRDARSDVFAFGALLLAMPHGSASLRRLAKQCTALLPKERPKDGAALVAALQPPPRRGVGMIVTALLAATVLGVGVVSLSPENEDTNADERQGVPEAPARQNENPPSPSTQIIQLTHNTDDGTTRRALVSPNGTYVALLETDGVWLLRLEDDARQQLTLPEDAGDPTSVAWRDDAHLLVSTLEGAFDVAWQTGVATPLPDIHGPTRIARDGNRVAFSIHRHSPLTHNALMEGPVEGPFHAVPLEGAIVDFAWSPQGQTLAVITLRSGSLTSSLWLYDVDTQERRVLLASERLMSDTGRAGILWSDEETLLVAMPSLPSAQQAPRLVITPAARWAPETVVPLEHAASSFSVAGGQLFFLQGTQQSDTVIAAWDGQSLSDLQRVSRSALDDRPTHWTEDQGLLAMMREDAAHRVVRIPLESGYPESYGPTDWRTWPHFTTAGLVSFHPQTETREITIEAWREDGARVLTTLHNPFGDEGLGRAVPRQAALDCHRDGHCVVAETTPSGVTITRINAHDGTLQPFGSPFAQANRIIDVALHPTTAEVAISTEHGIYVFDDAGALKEHFVAPGLYQYLAADRRFPGWFATTLSQQSPTYRLTYLRSGEAPRQLLGRDRDWLANPVVSPSGDRLAFSQMRFHSDLFRIALPE